MKLVSSKKRPAASAVSKKTGKAASPKKAPKSTSKKAPKKTQAPEKRSRKGGVIAAVIAGVVLVGAGTAGYVLVDKVSKLDTIFPGVTINGVDVSGMTEQEALDALGEAIADDLSAELVLPDGTSVSVRPEEVGIASSAEGLAAQAMAYGRGGSAVENAIAYYTADGTLDLMDNIYAGYDDSVLRQRVTEAVEAYNRLANAEPCVTTENSITLVKGAGLDPLDAEELIKTLTDGLTTAVETGESWSLQMPAQRATPVDLDALYESIYVEPVSSVYDKSTGGLTEAVTGVSFDLSAAKSAYRAADPGETLTFDIVYTEPSVTEDMLDELLFRDCLHHCETTLSGSSSNRITNIRLASQAINGIILNPGETFSYNNTLGERTEAKGYRMGISYIGGKAVPDLGGGICQVSSSLYCCAIHADLEIVERSNHMFLVSYLPLGIDATVAWGTCDFQFRNNMDFPIKIESYLNGSSSVIINMYGTKLDDGYIEITHNTVATIDYKTVEKQDPSIPAGSSKVDTSGRTGYIVDTYKNYYNADGTLDRTEYLDRSEYSKQDRVILVPVQSSSSSDSSSGSTGSSSEPVTPPADDSGSSEPVTPPADDSGSSEPVTPPADDSGSSEPVTPPADDSGSSEPVTPPADDSGSSEPATPPADDSGSGE